jgi:hypothetical protein
MTTKQRAAQAPTAQPSPDADAPAPDATLSDGTVSDGNVSDDTAPGASAFQTRHAAMRYTTLRLALFLCALVLVWGVAKIFDMDLSSQLSKLSLLAVALLLSSAVSFVVLSKQRDAMSAGLVARSERLSKRLNNAATFEDDEDDEDE